MERVPDGLEWWGLLLLVYLDHVEDLFSPTSVAQARYGHVMLQVFTRPYYWYFHPFFTSSCLFMLHT